MNNDDLPDGVLGLQAEEEAGGEVLDVFHAHLHNSSNQKSADNAQPIRDVSCLESRLKSISPLPRLIIS